VVFLTEISMAVVCPGYARNKFNNHSQRKLNKITLSHSYYFKNLTGKLLAREDDLTNRKRLYKLE